MNRDLERISNWAKLWLVSFNPDKTKSLYITLKPTVAKSDLTFDNHVLESTESHKHIGIVFNNSLTWKHHIDTIYVATNKKVFFFSKLKFLLDRKTLTTLYSSYIRPSLEYANIIWNNCTELESDKLESIQRRAARIITGSIVRTSSNLLYEETSLEPLVRRRERNMLLHFHKIINKNVPSYLHELKPITNLDRHGRNLRSNNNLNIPHCRINK